MIENIAERLSLTLLAAGLIPVAVQAAPALDAALVSRTEAAFADLDRPDEPGCALGVMRGGKLAYAKGYGLANVAAGHPITPDTVFAAASLSKQFTGFSILLLEQRGKLSLDDPITRYVPEAGAYADAITLRHLLHHLASLRDFDDLLLIDEQSNKLVPDGPEVIKILGRQRGTELPPGSEYMYGNSDYYLLSLVIRRVSGLSMDAFLRQEVFGPLGMKDSAFGDPDARAAAALAQSYSAKGGAFTPSPYLPAIEGAVGLRTTIRDLARWEDNFWTGKVGGMALIGRMMAPSVLNDGTLVPYGTGLSLAEYAGLPVVKHGGSISGFRHSQQMFMPQRFAVTVLCNRDDGAPDGRARLVVDAWLGISLPPEVRLPELQMLETDGRILPDRQQVGLYRHGRSGEYLRFWFDNSGMPTIEYQSHILPMEKISEHVFKGGPIRGWPVYIAFGEADGKRAALQMAFGGFDNQFDKIDTWRPQSLDRWTGTYWSDEARAHLWIVSTDGGLVAKIGGKDIAIAPGRVGEFIYPRGGLIVPITGDPDWVQLNVIGLRGIRFIRQASPKGEK